MPTNEQARKYYDALLANYDLLSRAIVTAGERGLKVSKQFASDVAKGQRDAIELGKKLAAEPTDVGQFYTSVLEATTTAQGRALAFAQLAYQEALTAGTDARETIEKLVEANRETAQAAVEVARTWATANPMAEFVRKGFEAMTPAGEKTAKKAKETANA